MWPLDLLTTLDHIIPTYLVLPLPPFASTCLSPSIPSSCLTHLYTHSSPHLHTISYMPKPAQSPTQSAHPPLIIPNIWQPSLVTCCPTLLTLHMLVPPILLPDFSLPSHLPPRMPVTSRNLSQPLTYPSTHQLVTRLPSPASPAILPISQLSTSHVHHFTPPVHKHISHHA